jgi:hypothetical protein
LCLFEQTYFSTEVNRLLSRFWSTMELGKYPLLVWFAKITSVVLATQCVVWIQARTIHP